MSDGDPDDAVETVADYCGVELARVPPDRVPLAEYRERGTVECDVCGRQPNPPELAVAVFGGETLCHECAAAELTGDLSALEAKAFTLHHFGWSPDDLVTEPSIAASSEDPEALLRAAQAGLE